MSSEFDSLTTLSDWSTRLAELLDAARAATTGSDDDRLCTARRLIEFVAHSHPASPDIQCLDQLAASAARALGERVANDAVDRIASRTALLESLTADLRSIRGRTETSGPTPSTALVDLVDRLSSVATDAAALARLANGNADDPPAFQARVVRLASVLFDLHEAFRSLSLRHPEPTRVGSGTVISEAPRATP